MRNCPVRRSMRIPATIDARRDITDGAEAHPRCWLSASAAQPPSHPQPWPASASTWAEPFDFDGAYLHLTGAFCNPKPVQRPHPPILIGGRSTATLRVVAEHADLWNIPGGDIDDAVRRGALLDRFCAEIGRDPASITRSIHLSVSYDHPSNTRDSIAEAIDAGFQHIVLGLPAPYPENVARWVTNELINKLA
jgi:alkanesulfonate monooxygenase SsuD/methylene tetrahydromethanopterin reductase-like flavin-dependent oxidoreductase (luciferase family)